MDGEPALLEGVLRKLFTSNAELRHFLQSYPYKGKARILAALPGMDTPSRDYFQQAVAQLIAHNLDTQDFFARLLNEFPGQEELIGKAGTAYLAGGEDSEAPTAPTSLLRSLAPFEDGDSLIGRDGEVQDIVTLVRKKGFRFGVVWGRSGCGKTSLLRAGLLPALRRHGYEVFYLDRPIEELWATLQSPPAPVKANGETKPLVVVVDQFEEIFLRSKDRAQRQRLAKLISTAITTPDRKVSLLIGIREEFFGDLHSIRTKTLPDPTRPTNCYRLDEFTVETAEKILRASRTTDATEFADELIKDLVGDLAVDGFVRPAELQIVASTLKQHKIRQRNRYVSLGGAHGVLQSYIEAEIAQCPDRQMAAVVLRQLCAEGRRLKSPTDVSKDTLAEAAVRAGLNLGHDRQNLELTLERLIEARLVVDHGADRYNLVHDVIALLVHEATAGIETAREKANRLLKKYVVEYGEDSKFRIPRHHMLTIWRNADRTYFNRRARELYRRSLVSAVGRVAITPLIICSTIGIAYGVVFLSEYISWKPAGLEAERTVVVRAGHPDLKILPGFDDIIIETDYTVSDIQNDGQVLGEDLVLFSRFGENGYSRWMDHLMARLTPPQELKAWRLVGQSERGITAMPGNLAGADDFWLGLAAAMLDNDRLVRLLEVLQKAIDIGDDDVSKMRAALAASQVLHRIPDAELTRKIYDLAFNYIESNSINLDASAFDIAAKTLITLIIASPDALSDSDVRAIIGALKYAASSTFDMHVGSLQSILRTIALSHEDNARIALAGFVDLAISQDLSTDLREIVAAHPTIVTPEIMDRLSNAVERSRNDSSVSLFGQLAFAGNYKVRVDTIRELSSCARSIVPYSNSYAKCALTLLQIGQSSTDDLRDYFDRAYLHYQIESIFALLFRGEEKVAQDDIIANILLRYVYHECRTSFNTYPLMYRALSIRSSFVSNETALTASTLNRCGIGLLIVAKFQPSLLPRDAVSPHPRDLGFGVLARSKYQQQKASDSISIDRIEQALRTSNSVVERAYGSYAAYLFWLDEEGERGELQKRLNLLAVSPDVEVRMAANRAREMIWIGQLTLVDIHNGAWGLARARLLMFAENTEMHIFYAALVASEIVADTRLGSATQK